jgi:plasmid stability protein
VAQLLVRNLEESVKRQLKKRADAHGRSLEGEVREILREAAGSAKPKDKAASQKGFGTRLAEIFADKVPEDFEIPRLRDEFRSPVDFDK